MIPPGGPIICAACLTLIHDPTPACPEPYECLSTECGHASCRERRYHAATQWGR